MAGEFIQVRVNRGTVSVFGDLRLSTFGWLSSALHETAVVARYPDITLDLASLSSITHSVVPPLAAQLRLLTRDQNVDFAMIEPRSTFVRNRIIEWGLGHYVEHRRFPKPHPNTSNPSLLQFLNHSEREVVTDRILNSALRTARLDRQHVAALEWAVNEISDNVMTHSSSKVGGFIMSHRVAKSNIIEFTVADAGIGIPQSLNIRDDTEAVEKAVQEGVTRNKSTNQGNGLYGTYRLACVSSGLFVMKSKHGNIYVGKEGDVHIRRDPVPYNGTFVVCQVDCDRPDLIEKALVFGGRPHVPGYDYIEKRHESEADDLNVTAIEVCKTFGSRQSGSEARQYISNLLPLVGGGSVNIDFSDVHVISSSFADEVFGKLFVELGPLRFMKAIKIKNASPVVEGLVDRAITLRTQTGL